MSTADTWFVVRTDDGHYRDSMTSPECVMDHYHHALPLTRVEAEQVVANLGGTVVRVTSTTEDVGLRWSRVGKSKISRIYDGAVHCGNVVRCDRFYEWWVCPPPGRTRYGQGKVDTLEEAKAAAEAAVRASWGEES